MRALDAKLQVSFDPSTVASYRFRLADLAAIVHDAYAETEDAQVAELAQLIRLSTA